MRNSVVFAYMLAAVLLFVAEIAPGDLLCDSSDNTPPSLHSLSSSCLTP
jgi:hypothetical protein